MQGILKVGQSRDDKLKRVTLKADESDITFALQVWTENLASKFFAFMCFFILLIWSPMELSIFIPAWRLRCCFYFFMLIVQGVRFFRNCLQ